MANNYSCIIFDFDGVIANTDLGRFKLIKNILEERKITSPKKISINDLIGLSTKSFLTKNFHHLNSELIEEIVKQRHEAYFSNLHQYCIPYEGMKSYIAELKSIADLAIVTTNSREIVLRQLKFLGIVNSFKWIIGRDITENENLVKTYEKISAALKKDVSECIVIEDSDFGVSAAKQVGYYCIRFDPDNIYPRGNEDKKVRSYLELKEVIHPMMVNYN